MSKWLLILLLPLALAGCVTEQGPTLPMTLGPSDTAKANCLTYADAPAFGDCKGAGTASVSQNTNSQDTNSQDTNSQDTNSQDTNSQN